MDIVTSADLSILLVEPSIMQSGLIAQKLKEQGATDIEICSDMASALDHINKYPPDLVFTNFHYPDGSAVDLLKKIRDQKRFEELPFILISSENRRKHLEIFKQSGVAAILSKPFSDDDLGKVIKATLALINKVELELSHYDIDTLRVIVVDDSRLARKAIVRVLRNLGINTLTEFDDGCHAIEYLRDNEVDLVVTDYNMPEVDGVELTKFIRKSEKHVHVPVLMVTSESKDSHLQFVSESGVSAISDKPFDTNSVKNLLVNILNH